ncbi:unnamed protein product [Tetraodon nigroviridis]|uniref:(spotted green pufferfish) hypothetical protein n=1 Tax=Tetraodon nigroviridis TaxID=99883 RepID=Q4S4F3_TETNG|nr:unnamed protein product [Tetraodon nigroviridis]
MITEKEKELLRKVWNSLIPVAEDIGSDSLLRMMIEVPASSGGPLHPTTVVHHSPRQQDVLLPPGHQSSLPPHALPWQEDCSGNRRRSPRHQPAGRQPGSAANPARLPAPDRPHQLQAPDTLSPGVAGLSHGRRLHAAGSCSHRQVPLSFCSCAL